MSDFTKNIIKILKGTIAGQFVLIATTPVLTRLYTPKDFGDLAIFTSLYSILVGIFTLKFELAIILPEPEQTAARLMRLSMLLSLSFSFLLLLALTYIGLFTSRVLPGYFFLLPFLTFVGAVYSVFQQWFSRTKAFQISAHSVIISSSCNVSLCFVLYYFASIAEGKLVVAYCAGFLLATLYLLFSVPTSSWKTIRSATGKMRHSFKEYSSFPKYMLPTALLSVLSYQIAPLLLERYFDTASVGFYSVANRFLVIPSVLLGAAINEVFRVELVGRVNRGEDIRYFFLRTLNKVLLIGIPLYLVVFAISPYVFEIILGKKFAASGAFAQYLCFAALGQFVAQPFNYIFVALGKMRLNLVLQSALSLAPVLALTMGSFVFNSIKMSLLLLSLFTSLVSIIFIFLAFRCVSQPQKVRP